MHGPVYTDSLRTAGVTRSRMAATPWDRGSGRFESKRLQVGHDSLVIRQHADLFVKLRCLQRAQRGDWESGSIGWVANRNNLRTLILRGVADLVGTDGGEAYEGNIRLFEEKTFRIMQRLVAQLPNWIMHAHAN